MSSENQSMFVRPGGPTLVIRRFDLLAPPPSGRADSERAAFIGPAVRIVRAIEQRYDYSLIQDVRAEEERANDGVYSWLRGKSRALGIIAFSRTRVVEEDSAEYRHVYDPCGYAVITDRRVLPVATLHRLRVHPDYQGHAIGAVMATAALDSVPNRGIRLLDRGRVAGLGAYDVQIDQFAAAEAPQQVAGPLPYSTVQEARRYVAQQYPDVQAPTDMRIVYAA